MKLYACDKDGDNFNRIDVASDLTIFENIKCQYDPPIEIKITTNPDGRADFKVEIDDPEKDNIEYDYYIIK